MIKNVTKYICDRCGKVAEVDYGEEKPDGWNNVAVKYSHKLLCPDCKRIYDKALSDFMNNKSDDTNKPKGRTYTIGIPNAGGKVATVECSLETEDLSERGLTVISTKYKVAKVDYSDNLALYEIEYYDDVTEAVKRYFNSNRDFNLVLKIVHCKDSEGKDVYKWYEWDAYGVHGFKPTDGRFGS